MNTAIITGASSGIGKNFVIYLERYFPDIEKIIVIARRMELLEELRSYTKININVLPLDLSITENFEIYKEYLDKEKPNVRLLINCAGYAKFDEFVNVDYKVALNMVNLNCNAVQAITYLTLPFMKEEARIINVSSMSAIQPVPYINTYAASKAFVLSFSRALNVELKKNKIRVMALVPYWVSTDFFSRANKNDIIKYYNVVYKPDFIVRKCYKAIVKKKPKDICVPGKYAKFQYCMVKLLPHRLVMKLWLHEEKLK